MHKVNEIFNLRTNNLLLYECLEQVTKNINLMRKRRKKCLNFLNPWAMEFPVSMESGGTMLLHHKF
jgi:hypothetical protein